MVLTCTKKTGAYKNKIRQYMKKCEVRKMEMEEKKKVKPTHLKKG